MHTRTNTAQDTEDFGWQLACARPPAEDALVVLYLTGELGAGKTTFARGFLRALGVTEPVRSPTYTLLEIYAAESLTLLHIDLYRIHDGAEIESLGLREWAREGCVWLIEWPERAEGRLPLADMTLAFTVGPAWHEVTARAHSALGKIWLAHFTGDHGSVGSGG